jgi:hypothetical protein
MCLGRVHNTGSQSNSRACHKSRPRLRRRAGGQVHAPLDSTPTDSRATTRIIG